MASIDDDKHGWDFHVAGIGASAGGIHALRSFVLSLPEKLGLAFVVVQHQAPQSRSILVELLGKHSALPIKLAVDGMRVEVDHIYIAPSDSALTVEQGLLRCRPFTDQVRPGISTVDTLFASLASDCGPKAIGIVLTGTGSDGAKGVVEIKQGGGTVFVQDPTTSMHNGMPCAAIFTGVVDHVCPIEALAHELLVCTSGSAILTQTSSTWNKEAGKALEAILATVYRYAEYDLSGYKVTPLLWRIQHRMRVRKVRQFSDYHDLLQDDAAELESLLSGLPIHVTAFFRNAEAWTVLRQHVIEPLTANRALNEPIRVWTPACSTGEEAYSVAMLLCEANDRHEDANFTLFATDALPEIVGRASRGQFSEAAVEALGDDRRTSFFYPVDGAYRIKRSLREKIIFAPQRLLSDPPFADLDLITCRNLLIYLEPEAQQRLLMLLHSSLRTGGYLFLGDGEALSPKQQGFEVISSKWHIYRKTGSANCFEVDVLKDLKAANTHQTAQSLVAAVAHQVIIERLDLPSVLMDVEFNILRVYGNTSGLLQLPAGEPTLNLLQVAQPRLLPDLERTVRQALAERRTITCNHYSESDPGGSVNIRVTPLQNGDNGKNGRLLVSFIAGGPSLDSSMGETLEPARESAPLSNDMLRISIEELDASRAELQALNEELRAVNDQLKISNDEINEVNAQLRSKIGELETQGNVLSSGYVMTLFLDEDLRVRWFTPAVAELFPLRTGDAGRRITDLVPKVKDDQFLTDVREVMQHGQLLEAEVLRGDGRWFLRQIRPFRTQTESTTGVAVTFNDITDRKQAEDAVAEEFRNTKILQGLSAQLVTEESIQTIYEAILTAAIEIMRADAGMVQMFNEESEELVLLATCGFSQATREYFHRVDASSSTSCGLALGTGARAFLDFDPADMDVSIRLYVNDGVLSAQSSPLISRTGKAIGMISTHWREADHRPLERELGFLDLLARQAADVIERQIAKQALRESEEKYRTLFETMGQGYAELEIIRGPDGRATDVRYLELNPQYERLTGIPVAKARGRTVLEMIPDLDDWWIQEYDRIVRSGLPGHVENEVTASGRWYEAKIYPRAGERFSVLSEEITDRKKAEAALRESEEKYRTLFDTMDEGYAVVEVLRDESGRVFDVKGVEINRAYTAKSGIPADFVGRPFSEFSTLEDRWLQIYDEVQRTGQPIRTENYWAGGDRWLTGNYSRVGGEGSNLVAIVFDDVTKRKKAEIALRESEEKFRTLFETIDEGFCIVEVLRNDKGQPVDLLYHEVNQAVERISGLQIKPGQRARGIQPHIEDSWFDFYDQVVRTGVPVHAENFNIDTNRWYRFSLSRIGADGSSLVSLVFTDLTDRKRAEERQAFLLKLSDAMRPLNDPRHIKATATHVLGEHLAINRAFYAEVENDDWIVARGYDKGVPPLLDGPYSADTYGAWIMEIYRASGRIVFRDTQHDPRFTAAERDAHAAAGIIGAVGIPLVKKGRLVAILAVHTVVPHDWTEDEIGMIEETAERTWAAVERASAEAALRESEEKFRTLFESMDEGFFFGEAIFDQNGVCTDLFYLEENPAAIRMVGQSFKGCRLSELGMYEQYWLDIFGRTARTGEAQHHELYAAPDGIWYEFHVFKPAQSKENQFAVVFYDVTTRHKATEALRESERRLHLAIQAGAMGTYVWDPQEDRGEQDAQMMRLFGREGEIITLREVLGEIVHPDDREWYAATVQKSLDPNGDGKLDTDFRVIHPNGSTHWLHIYGQTIFTGEPPKPVRMHGAAFDITEQKRAEEALRESEEKYRTLFETMGQSCAPGTSKLG